MKIGFRIGEQMYKEDKQFSVLELYNKVVV